LQQHQEKEALLRSRNYLNASQSERGASSKDDNARKTVMMDTEERHSKIIWIRLHEVSLLEFAHFLTSNSSIKARASAAHTKPRVEDIDGEIISIFAPRLSPN
jgi:hypothetical protein